VASDVFGEVLAQRALQRPQRVGEPGLVGGRQPHLPTRQLHHELDPLAPGEIRAPPPLELAETRDEIARQPLLADAVALQQSRDHRQDLPRLDRLHEIVVHLDADGFAQGAFVLALRDHHDGHRGVERPDLDDQLEPPPSGHLLVEEHDAVRLAPQQRERVIAVRRGRDREPLVLEEAPMCGEPVHLVVHPENRFRPHHAKS